MIDEMHWPLMHDATMPQTSEGEGVVSSMDEDEFRAFYERTARPLWAYVLRMTADRTRSEDVLQEAYYRFYRAGTKYDSESHRRNSLFRIATNIVRDSARRAKHRGTVSLDDHAVAAETPRSEAPAPERQAEIRTDLGRAMGQLEPLHREMLWLAYAQGASHEEIAGILGVRAVSVRTLLLRARKKIVRIMNGDNAAAAVEKRS